ncbi:MAG: excinuclease ABC subunit A [Proteobacteria bacterium]|nr:excinuclease ABC subunit A [Pseudomonadota bacterium]MBU1685907.1 excinuclease ABC subunit A [Pseudomonadota bacterium]
MDRDAKIFMAVLFSLLFCAGSASAADQWHQFPVDNAIHGALGKDKLLPGIKLFMKGEKHPGLQKKLGEFEANKRSNGLGKSDQVACDVAFLSALISLQSRAQREGGNAVVDIYTITKDRKFESVTEYSCLAGKMVVNVALMGTVAQLDD